MATDVDVEERIGDEVAGRSRVGGRGAGEDGVRDGARRAAVSPDVPLVRGQDRVREPGRGLRRATHGKGRREAEERTLTDSMGLRESGESPKKTPTDHEPSPSRLHPVELGLEAA